jgi:hypothetical protein
MKKKYLIFPKIQLKYSLLLSALTLIQGLATIFFIYSLLNRPLEEIIAENNFLIFKQEMVKLGIALALINAFIVFSTCIFILHRFLGPIISINRSLQKFEETGEFEDIRIRKSDEMHILVDRINFFLRNKKK